MGWGVEESREVTGCPERSGGELSGVDLKCRDVLCLLLFFVFWIGNQHGRAEVGVDWRGGEGNFPLDWYAEREGGGGS